MDRLDQILHAEDRASKTIDAAREQARSLASETKSEADLIVATAEREAREEAERHKQSVRNETEREVEQASQQAAAEMRTHIAAAEDRIGDAVEAVIEELTN